MDYFASQDPRSYSFYFDLNISFLARKVIGTLEKRVPAGPYLEKARACSNSLNTPPLL